MCDLCLFKVLCPNWIYLHCVDLGKMVNARLICGILINVLKSINLSHIALLDSEDGQ